MGKGAADTFWIAGWQTFIAMVRTHSSLPTTQETSDTGVRDHFGRGGMHHDDRVGGHIAVFILRLLRVVDCTLINKGHLWKNHFIWPKFSPGPKYVAFRGYSG